MPKLRHRGSALPVLMLNANGAAGDRWPVMMEEPTTIWSGQW